MESTYAGNNSGKSSGKFFSKVKNFAGRVIGKMGGFIAQDIIFDIKHKLKKTKFKYFGELSSIQILNALFRPTVAITLIFSILERVLDTDEIAAKIVNDAFFPSDECYGEEEEVPG